MFENKKGEKRDCCQCVLTLCVCGSSDAPAPPAPAPAPVRAPAGRISNCLYFCLYSDDLNFKLIQMYINCETFGDDIFFWLTLLQLESARFCEILDCFRLVKSLLFFLTIPFSLCVFMIKLILNC